MQLWLIICLYIILLISIFSFGRFFYTKLKNRLYIYVKQVNMYFEAIEKRYIKPLYFNKTFNDSHYWCIIISFNRKYKIKDLIVSLKQYEPNAKILIVDNGSTDNTQEMLIQLLNDGIIERLIFNNNNSIPQWQKSFSLHQAFQILQTENPKYLSWIDDDVIVTNKFLDKAIKIINNNKNRNIKVVSLIDDEQQELVHKTIELIDVDGEIVKIKSSFSGQFVFFESRMLSELGLPPIGEGINELGVEDWYYSRMLEYTNSKAAIFKAGIHLGYESSIRESIEINL